MESKKWLFIIIGGLVLVIIILFFLIGKIIFQCGGQINYQGDSYSTVKIGEQCWMKQSLNVGTRIAGNIDQGTSCTLIQKYCYDDSDANCTSNNPNYSDGALYQWDQAMCGSTTEGAQGICPDGWHIPTDAEYKILEIYLGMTQVEADTYDWRGTDQGTKLLSNETSGFEGNLAGYRYAGGFSDRPAPALGYFWSSTQYETTGAWHRALHSEFATVARGINDKVAGFSVRCLKN
jgi:uncharacterized protein (TIGR02145 family)